MKNKVIALFLSITVLFSTGVITNADVAKVSQERLLEMKVANLNDADIETAYVQSFVNLYNNSGLVVSDISIEDNSLVLSLSDESYLSTASTNPIYSRITIVEANYDNTKVIIEEDGTKDIINYYSDGSVFLNGNEVEIVYENQGEFSNSMVTRGVHYVTYTCPYGTAASYNDLRQNIEKSVNFKKIIADMGISTLISLMKLKLGDKFEIVASTAKDIIQAADKNASESTCLSLKRSVYWHKNGYIVNGKGIEKWVTKYYYQKNFVGYAGKDTKYSVYG